MSKITALSAASTQRIDAEYFRKQYLRDASVIAKRPDDFCRTSDLGIDVDASAFYPSIEEQYGLGNLPFLRVGDVDGFIDSDRCIRIPDELTERFPTLCRVRAGDILFTKGGAIDRVGLVSSEAAVSRDLIFLTTSKLTVVDRQFLFAYFCTPLFKRMLVRSSSQTTQPHLTITLVRELPLFKGSRKLKETVSRLVSDAFSAKTCATRYLDEGENALRQALGIESWSPPEPLSYISTLSALSAAGRWDSQFHSPKVDDVLARLAKNFDLVPIGSLGEVTNGNPVAYSETGTIPIIRSGDLIDIDDDSRFLRTTRDQDYFELRRGDVLISSIGFGSIGKVQVFDKSGTFGTVSEVTVIRQDKFDPYFLAAYLRSQPGQLQIDRWITGATGQLHLYPRDVKRIQVPLVSRTIQAACRKAAEDARAYKKRAESLLDAAKRAIGIAIEDSEEAALRHLKDAGE